MSRIDRLSALLSHFQMAVRPASNGEGNLVILGNADTLAPHRIEFYATHRTSRRSRVRSEVELISLQGNWSDRTNPIIHALSDRISLPVNQDDEMNALIQLVLAEARAQRCGANSVLSRLGEIILVRLIRAEIERGKAKPGLVAGLSNPRISKAIVALHEGPGRSWRNEELAEVAGLSLSRFADVFKDCMGCTPQAYLRHWRLTLAYQDISRGDRIKSVSRRYGYASSEALARAFNRQFGTTPLTARREARL